ncbi:DddA-like double-stranded DNA deaminase toxin [Actinokineospora sp. NBRC 105648]|uniref:DddA-like double-stranded DNA deaminase toxin n=1 Tax=Actinokineospora sp. NBRC 105648 TaxID=3032206 RepID=UPI00332C5F1B
MSLNSNNSTKPREISSRSANVNISRTTGHPSPPNTKFTCYDRLNLPSPGASTPKTHGRWIGPNGTTRGEVSGKDDKYDQAVAYFESRPGGRVPLRASDVEMKLAVHMRCTALVRSHS